MLVQCLDYINLAKVLLLCRTSTYRPLFKTSENCCFWREHEMTNEQSFMDIRAPVSAMVASPLLLSP